MAVPLSLGLLCATISRQARNVRPTLRDRLLWFTSADASQAILLVAAVSLMALSIVLTMSRSGMLAAACAICATIAAAWRGYPGAQRFVVIGTVLAIAAVAVGWAGLDSIVARFQEGDVREFSGRLGAWSDALNIASHYPIAGTGLNTYGVAMLFYQRFNVGVTYRRRTMITCKGFPTVGASDLAHDRLYRGAGGDHPSPVQGRDEPLDVLDSRGRNHRHPVDRPSGNRRFQSADPGQRVPVRRSLRDRDSPDAGAARAPACLACASSTSSAPVRIS